MYLPFRKDLPTVAMPAQATLAGWAAAHRIPMLNLSSAELAYPMKAISLDGDHLNVLGDRIVAAYVEKHWPAPVDGPEQ